MIQNLTWHNTSMHMDKEFMKSTQFGERLFAGPCVLNCMIGLEPTMGWMAEIRAGGLKNIAGLGIDQIRFKHPVHPGDTLTAQSQFVAARPSAKNPKRIVLKRKVSATNQRGEAVAQCFMVSLYEIREDWTAVGPFRNNCATSLERMENRALDRRLVMGTVDVPVGKVFISRGRTISEGDFTVIQNLTWHNTSVHMDKEFMKSTQFGERLFAGPCVLNCMIGLETTSGWIEEIHARGLRSVAMLGIDEVRFGYPVRPGDTLVAHSEFIEARPSAKNPKRIVHKRKVSAFNQHGQKVAECLVSGLFEKEEG